MTGVSALKQIALLASHEPPHRALAGPSRLSTDSRRILIHVLAAIQAADEYDSTESDDYINLMEAIMDEAAFRRDACRREFAMTGT